MKHLELAAMMRCRIVLPTLCLTTLASVCLTADHFRRQKTKKNLAQPEESVVNRCCCAVIPLSAISDPIKPR